MKSPDTVTCHQIEAQQLYLLSLKNYITFDTTGKSGYCTLHVHVGQKKNKTLKNRITSIAALLFLIFSLKALHEGGKKNTKEQKAKTSSNERSFKNYRSYKEISL